MIFIAVSIPRWLHPLLGFPPQAAPSVEQTRLAFATPWPLWALLLLLLAAAGWFGYCYWKDGTRPSWRIKGPLVALRLLALCALLILLAQPTLRLRQVDTIRPNVVLLVDTSESMNRPDPKLPTERAQREATATGTAVTEVGRLTRLERANRLLNHAGLLAELSQTYTVRLYTFATAPRPLSLPTDPKQIAAYRFALTSDTPGDTTQIGTALRRPVEELAGQPVAGALLLSDGGNNQGEDPIPAADAARQMGLPVSAIGLGDPTKTKDLALISVLADDVVRSNNVVTVYAALTQRGYSGRAVTVTLLRDGEEVGREVVRLGPDEQKQEARFTYTAEQAGRYRYTVAISPQPDEITLANNKKSFLQTVITKKLKVLYVENEPRYEYRYLRNAILRDTSLEFACLLLSSEDTDLGNIAIREFPRDEKALFEYDIILLGDVPRATFSESQLEALRRFVEDRGGSLLVIAGEQHMPHEFAGTPLEAVLPTVINPTPDPLLSDEPFQMQLTPEGRRSPISQLEDSAAESARVWGSLPGMFWAAGVPRAKPGATVLAVHPTRRNAEGPYVLAAQQPFGAGKSFIQLVDSTYLWRKRVGDRYFYRYWGQVFRALTPKELPGNSRFVQINADRDTARLGEKITLNARLLNAFYRPITANSVTALVRAESGQTQRIALLPTPGSPGLFTAQFQPDRVGRYEVTLTSPVNPQAKASAGFLVESLALERQKPELDEAFLKKLAAAGGGSYYAPDALSEWVKSLSNNPQLIPRESEIELWNAPLFLILFVTPLAIEWLVRKRKGLL
jgi:hypothetical protein